ncbi:Uncharacterised protein [Mycolicibacterium vanbaalenii]|uniref:UsfY protein n=1 Tax=Mycolicibacterium vanbaalenii TaxID=110539 RepID=A0A5S9QJU8_MYCVN|nr:hypothetical protein [Mycolicibacterium vanbaalenii]CAA0118594.1 Uncharacterised protein [Mycolicibacterium vanbaalenii]
MAEMAESRYSSDDPFNETVATTGLFLLVTAIIAVAFGLASWGMSETLIAVLAGFVAVLSFTASIMCFKAQATELPADAPA